MTRSCLYRGTVVHRRLRPRRHAFRYEVTAWYLDLDELAALDRDLPGFGWNRVAPISFHDSDHGAGDGGNLRSHVERCLARHGVQRPHRIGLLSYPRMFGYAFNPLSVYFCHDHQDRLLATLHEVRNTFGQSHTYLIGAGAESGALQHQTARKNLYVSPFMPMDCVYRFRLRAPHLADPVSIGIRQNDAEGAIFNAVFVGQHVPLRRSSVARLILSMPLMTLKVTAAIHYEALRLWLKGVPLVPRPSPPDQSISRGYNLPQPTIKEHGS